MRTDSDWPYRVATLRDRALAALDAERFDEARACIKEAFAIVDADGDENHAAFARLLGVAADVALALDIESALPLYTRLYQCGRANGHRVFMANALRGISEVHLMLRSYDLAYTGLGQALALLEGEDDPDATNVRQDIVDILECLEVSVARASVSEPLS